MPGASSSTVRVRAVNANRAAGDDGSSGRFEFLIVTEDGERHSVAPSPSAAATLLQLVQVGPVLLWDPDNRTVIAADLVGGWLPPDWSGLPRSPDR